MALRSLWAHTSVGRRSLLNYSGAAASSSLSFQRGLEQPQQCRQYQQQQQQQLSQTMSLSYEELVVEKEEVVRFIADSMRKVGSSSEDAVTVAHHLMIADYRGHFSHGMNRMKMYVNDIRNKLTDATAKPKIVNDFQAIALVDGCNGLGQIVGKYCMELAIDKARKFGIGLVSARGSNHYGICAYYTLMAIEQDMIGFSCTNTSPLMAPTRSSRSALGTNPLSLGMGASGGDQFVLDMATTAVALGKIELAHRKGESIPEGWAMDNQGKVTTDADKALEASTLMPLGGEEKNSGYKGYGLATMVEVLCGVLSGSKYGPNIRSWKAGNDVANLGQCFMAINPEVFAPGSKDRLAHLLQQLRELPRIGEKEVLVAGDPERAAMEKVDKEGGIHYHENQIKNSADFAKEIGVEPMKLVKKTQ